jgi:hypothetical protein
MMFISSRLALTRPHHARGCTPLHRRDSCRAPRSAYDPVLRGNSTGLTPWIFFGLERNKKQYRCVMSGAGMTSLILAPSSPTGMCADSSFFGLQHRTLPNDCELEGDNRKPTAAGAVNVLTGLIAGAMAKQPSTSTTRDGRQDVHQGTYFAEPYRCR